MLAPSLLSALTLVSAAAGALAATADQWRGRSIYQVVTDRFARTDGSTTAACNTADRVFCGGTWRGIINKLDYIQDMGFTAIWISPVIEQIYGNTDEGEAYHGEFPLLGYWPKDYYTLNPNFGTEQDLNDLVTALHDRGMYVMVDIVVNHFASWGDGSIPYSELVPFNNSSYFHKKCWINWSNQASVEQCWMGNGQVPLMDLDTENTYVVNTLEAYIADFVKEYSVDGLRIDATKNVRKDFWPGFCKAAGVYCQGEVWSNDPSYFCPYQNVMDGLHNYPIKEYAASAFQTSKGSLTNLVSVASKLTNQCKDVSLLGSFMENQDNARMGSLTTDMARLKNYAALNIFSGGIPVVYYGQEQLLTGASDPNNREALWLTGYPTTGANLVAYFTQLNTLRNAISTRGKDKGFLTAKPIYKTLSASVLSVRKGNMLLALTNAGSGAAAKVTADGFGVGVKLMDVLACEETRAGWKGELPFWIGAEPKLFYPKALLAGSGICGL
ncbi:glycoside hydrolase family 13 protein [Heliocybe sulcata]|uniref:alpha-amylase n=1 Tax=Heliocybe sulcata TaxID=5364 RepID=A0A5C3MJR2_9AGAM|nr:glycoside hydrolase family 13 protein [Heliocybe sulcata]